MRRMARAYGINPTEIESDPAFPLVAAFGAAPLDSEQLRDDIRRVFDEYGQFDLVLMESFYNFHPAAVDAKNLYERGQVLDAYHKFIQSVGGPDTTSLLTDHYRSTGKTNSMDLDNISMAGQARAPTAGLRGITPRRQMCLRVIFGYGPPLTAGSGVVPNGRLTGSLGPFDHDVGHHVGEIGWDVRSVAWAEGGSDKQGDNIVRQILQVVRDNEFELTETQVVKEVGGNKQKGYDTLTDLKANDFVVVETRERVEGSKKRTRKLVGLGPRGDPDESRVPELIWR